MARGGIWYLLGDVAVRLSALIRLSVLARLLGPEDFGLLGIALTLQGWIRAFSQTGVRAALIQQTGNITAHLNQAWMIQVVRGIGFLAIMCAISPLAASFFKSPESAAVIATLGLAPLIHGFGNPAAVFLSRDLDFRKEVVLRLWGTASGLVSGIVLALWLRNVWALVLSILAAQLAETVASYWVRPFRPHLSWDSRKTRDLFDYGRWIFWDNMLDQLNQQIDSLAVGRWIGTRQLGIYQVSRQISYLTLNGIGIRFGGLLFPAFSKLAKPSLAAEPFLRSVRALLSVLLPMVSALTMYSEVVVTVAVGEKWPDAAPVAAVLAWAGLARVISSIPRACLQGIGSPHKVLLPGVARLVLAGGGLALFTRPYGLLGVSATISVSAAVWTVLMLAAATRQLQIGPMRLIRTAGPGILYAAPIYATAPLLSGLDWATRSAMALLIVAACTGAGAYAVAREARQLSPNGQRNNPVKSTDTVL